MGSIFGIVGLGNWPYCLGQIYSWGYLISGSFGLGAFIITVSVVKVSLEGTPKKSDLGKTVMIKSTLDDRSEVSVRVTVTGN